MMVSSSSRRALLLVALAILPFLVGSRCVVLYSSDNGSSDEDDRDREDNGLVVVASGSFGDPPVSGLRYVSGALSGTTGENGEFQYEPEGSVQFFLGDIGFGPPVKAKPNMTPDDLVAGEAPAGTNIRRLLASLDADPGNDAIAIPAEVRAAAVLANEDVAPAIGLLDFADDAVFANTASQLVAVLTSDYSFTAILVNAEDVAPPPTRSVAR